ncbi:alpha/beta fold hydrolase [Cohnella luojiensis]|uniref:Alpha/beta hydrolase n=1 Tax=Cohnella luojiensis TaxID=652876 RepID=A0A4Y8LS38_9BACL|nr:alpha/beta hydrolase [Cohnella luojiensis]TFE23736.1 alpha/beta hydrolase [Cohnella luojiensis]
MGNAESIKEKIGFVFIHGAGLEGRIWKRVAESLDRPRLLVDFPLRQSAMESRRELTLHDYAKDVQRQIKEWEVKRFIIVAHSLGGVVALQAAELFSERLAGFVAVGAAIPNKGGSFLSILPLPKRLLMSIILRLAGTKPPESAIRAGLCNDLSLEQVDEIIQRFVPESVRVYTDSVKAVLPEVPRLYVKLTNDKEFGQPLQDRMIRNLSPERVVTLNTGHMPMLSDPDGLSVILKDIASEWV